MTAASLLWQYTQSVGDYNDIVREFNSITQKEKQKEQKLAQLMYNYCHSGRLASLKELQAIHEKITLENVESINQLFYRCFVKDISSWLLSKENEERVPFATAQSRALWLIKEGYLSIQQVFAKNAPFGIFTGVNSQDLQSKMARINDIYNKATLERKKNNFPSLQYAGYLKSETKKPASFMDHSHLEKTKSGITVH